MRTVDLFAGWGGFNGGRMITNGVIERLVVRHSAPLAFEAMA